MVFNGTVKNISVISWLSVLLLEETGVHREDYHVFLNITYYKLHVYLYRFIAAASDKVYQLFAHGRWFSSGTPASSITNNGCHDIAESGAKHKKNIINHI